MHLCNSKIKQLQHIHKPHVTFYIAQTIPDGKSPSLMFHFLGSFRRSLLLDIGVNTGGTGGRVPPEFVVGGRQCYSSPPRFWPVGHMLCNESLSSAQVPGLRYSSPPGSRCGMTMTRISLAPLRPTTAVMFRRDVTASAFCRRVISCLLAENAGNLLPSVTLMMYTDKLCYNN